MPASAGMIFFRSPSEEAPGDVFPKDPFLYLNPADEHILQLRPVVFRKPSVSFPGKRSDLASPRRIVATGN